MLASEKYDGVRTIIMDGVAYSRMMIPLHDVFQKRFKPFLDKTIGTEHVFDCEIFNPDATFQQITSSIANEDGVPLKLYAFDYLTKEEWFSASVTEYLDRCINLGCVIGKLDPNWEYIRIAQQKICDTRREIEEYFNEVLERGGEGLMLRSPSQLYKHGRSTAKQGDFLKLKDFQTLDGIIVGYNQKARLTEEAKEYITDKDAFGRSKRGHRKDDRELVDEIGSVIVKITQEPFLDEECGCMWKKGSPVRTMITWNNKESFVGKHVEIEFQPCGSKDLPRIGRIIRLRPDLDN